MRLSWMLASALFAVLVYFTLVYAFTEVESIRVKLDIEWLQFFLLAGLAETLLSYRDKARKQRAAEATAPVAETSGSLPPA